MNKHVSEALYSVPDWPLRRQFKKVPGLIRLKRLVSGKFDEISTRIDEHKHRHEINTIKQFLIFAPNSTGSFEDLMQLTVTAANQTFPFIVQLIESATGVLFSEPAPIRLSLLAIKHALPQ